MSRREEVLAEMGLAPIWKLKGKKEARLSDDWIPLKAEVSGCTACGLAKTGRLADVTGSDAPSGEEGLRRAP